MALSFDTPDWLRHWGSLLVGYGIIGPLVMSANVLFGSFFWPINVSALLLVGSAWTFIWFRFDVPPPRNTTERFGIGIFVTTESEKARFRLENDILARMRETIEAQGLGQSFELVAASDQQATKYIPALSEHRNQLAIPEESRSIREDRSFAAFQTKTNCHFFVWGTLIERKDAELGGKPALILRTDALVIHSQIPQFRTKILGDQFKWPKEIKISEDAEYQGLQFTADEFVLIADLVIGSAAAMVGNAIPALDIHEKLLQHIEKLPATPHRVNVKKHVAAMIVDELSALAAVAYLVSNDATLAKDYLQRAASLKPNDHGCLVLLARIQFEHDNDPATALATTHRMKPVADGIGIWRYNVAFLEMFTGDHKASWKMYQEIFRTDYPGENDTVFQVIEFNQNQAKKGFLPSVFIISVLFLKKVANLPESLRYVETFLAQAKGLDSLSFLVKQATAVREEVLRGMQLPEDQ